MQRDVTCRGAAQAQCCGQLRPAATSCSQPAAVRALVWLSAYLPDTNEGARCSAASRPHLARLDSARCVATPLGCSCTQSAASPSPSTRCVQPPAWTAEPTDPPSPPPHPHPPNCLRQDAAPWANIPVSSSWILTYEDDSRVCAPLLSEYCHPVTTE